MSGDVQPRKRKEKRKKKDGERAKAEAEFLARKLSTVGDDSDDAAPIKVRSSPQPTSSFNEGDSVIHVHHEGGTGGHWCAKIIFFALLGVLVALVGLIIIENRGLTDLDTPVSESRFAQVFDGWVDEGPIHDDHHDEHTLELNHPEDHDEDDHDNEEIEDIESENEGHDDEGSDDEAVDHQSDDEDDHDEEDDEHHDEDEENEVSREDHDDDDDDADDDENDEDEVDHDEEEDASTEDNEDDDNQGEEDDDDDDDDYLNVPLRDDDAAENDDGDDNEEPFDEVDSVEEDIVDNAALEEEHLAAKQAEQLAQEENTDNTGMRVGVGVALALVAYCVLARKWRNASDEPLEVEMNRRMTLIPDQSAGDVIDAKEEVHEKIVPVKSNVVEKAPIKEESDDEKLEQENIFKKISNLVAAEAEQENVTPEYDDTEDVSDEGEELNGGVVIIEDIEIINEPEPNDEELDEAEEEDICEEELLEEEELAEEEDEIEEDLSEEMDDSELMKKLEAKYGKLPELDDEPEGHSDEDSKPVAPARRKPKPSGGNSVEDEIDEWTEEDNAQWNQQLNLAQAEMDEGKLDEAYRRFTSLSLTNTSCWRAKLGRAKVLDSMAEKRRSNSILQNAIEAYREVLKMKISNKTFLEVAARLINRMRFKGNHIDVVPVQQMLIERFPDEPDHHNQMAISFLMVNKYEDAKSVLENALKKWPDNGVALVHYGFILKTRDNNLEEAVKYLRRGLNTKEKGTAEGRFLFHLGDALSRLGRNDEANEIYEYGASIGEFLSPQQRSLYNVDRLTGRPWWNIEQTPYLKLIKKLETNWKSIAQESRQLRPDYMPEKENLKDKGDWSQFELFIRGVEVKKNCMRCPITCGIVKTESAAYGCRRGQVKFSAMSPGTHVFAHTGPTNCRLRAHLGLQGTKDTFIRVANETRSWEEGRVIIFDDSFEHEVWHNGTDLRIVLIVDLWHPELTKEERVTLPAI